MAEKIFVTNLWKLDSKHSRFLFEKNANADNKRLRPGKKYAAASRPSSLNYKR